MTANKALLVERIRSYKMQIEALKSAQAEKEVAMIEKSQRKGREWALSPGCEIDWLVRARTARGRGGESWDRAVESLIRKGATNGVDPFVFAGAAVDAFEEAMTAQ